MRLAPVDSKGGAGKATSAVVIAAGLARPGRTILIAGDPQGPALAWSRQDPGFGCTARAMPGREVHRKVAGPGRGYAHVVIGSPPGDLGVIASCVMAADAVLVRHQAGSPPRVRRSREGADIVSPTKRPGAATGLQQAMAAAPAIPAPAPAPAQPGPQLPPREPKPIRFTLDLDRPRHQFLALFAAQAELNAAQVMRAVLDELQADPSLADRVRDRAWHQKQR
jgi:hypothetical protein